MMNKNIQDKKIPIWKKPLRFVYRIIIKFVNSNQEIKQVNVGGIKYVVWANEDIGKKLLIMRRFESMETAIFKHNLSEGDVCLDIGGNIGYYSVNMSKLVGHTGRVYVFEPVKRNWLMIQLALDINGLSENTTVYNEAISNYDGEVLIEEPEDGAYAHISTNKNKSGQKVICKKVDTFVKEEKINKIDAIKIDVEGAELLVLEGARSTLKRIKPKLIMVELVSIYLERYNSSIRNVVAFMEEHGYSPYVTKSSGSLVPYTKNDYDEIFNVFFIIMSSEDRSKVTGVIDIKSI